MPAKMVRLRKEKAGSDSFGHVWAEDGAIVAVPHDQAVELLAIPGGGFTAVGPPTAAGGVEQVAEPAEAAEVTEPAPGPEAQVTEPAPKARQARRTGGKRPAGG